MTAMAGKSVVVVGGGRGLGLGVSRAASDAGAHVTVVSRSPVTGFAHEHGDAADEAFADKVLAAHRPDLLVVTAGAVPVMRPLVVASAEAQSASAASTMNAFAPVPAFCVVM